MAVLPTRLLEVEFDAGVWTDVAADAVATTTRRGRNSESGAFETGQMVFTLRNDTRTYDPDNTAGPYYGKLRPNRRVRMRATYNAVTYPVFLGYLDRIEQVYGGPNDATAEFQVSDAFKLLNRVELPRSVYMAELLSGVSFAAPAALWLLDEPAGSTAAVDSQAGHVRLDAGGTPTFGADGLVVRDPGSAVTIVSGQRLARTGPFLMTGAPLTIELWYKHTPSGAQGTVVGQLTSDLLDAAYLQIISSNVVFVINRRGVGQAVLVSSGVTITDGAAHHIAAVWQANGTLKIYIDGVDRSASAVSLTAGTFVQQSGETVIGSAGIASEGTYQMVAFYNSDLTSTGAALHNTVGRTPWTGDASANRIGSIVNLSGIALADWDLGAGTTVLQATDLGGSALAYIQKLEETERGAFFVARDGKLTWRGRDQLVTSPYTTNQATLVDADSGAGLPYRFVSADVDEARIVTRATVSREGSVAVTYADAAAVAEFKTVDEVHEGLLHASDAYSLSYAQWIVSTHKNPTSRVGTLTAELTTDPANLYPGILDLEIGEKVTYKRKPQNTGAVISLEMRVEAIAHATGGGYWTTTLQLSPFNPGEGGWPVGIWDVTPWDQSVWGI